MRHFFVRRQKNLTGKELPFLSDFLFLRFFDLVLCDDELDRRFAYVRYYLIVVKGGVIPPKYLKVVD